MYFYIDLYMYCIFWNFRGYVVYGSVVNLKNNNKVVGGKYWNLGR